ncbi:MAG: hypothetical protein KHX42_07475 [Prevotella sp.]|nr:hypothetical protein [Prevotella sp.]
MKHLFNIARTCDKGTNYNTLIIKMIPSAIQKAAYREPICRLSHSERAPFRSRYAAF